VVKFKTKIDFNDKKVIQALQNAKKHILWRQGQEVITQAQTAKLVPLDTGTLRRSAVVTLEKLPDMQSVFKEAEKGSGDKPVVVDSPGAHAGDVDVAYVSYNTPYAAALHEDSVGKKHSKWKPRDWKSRNPDPNSNKYMGHKKVKQGTGDAPGEGGPKWLEKAVAMVRHKFPEIAKSIMKRYFK
jgi:hypothetical protein